MTGKPYVGITGLFQLRKIIQRYKEHLFCDEHYLLALGQQAEETGFAGMTSKLVSRNPFNAALTAARMRIRYAQWTTAMSRIMHATAVHGCLVPLGLSVATK